MLIKDTPDRLHFRLGGNLVTKLFALVMLLPGVFVLYSGYASGMSVMMMVFGGAMVLAGLNLGISVEETDIQDEVNYRKMSLLGLKRRNLRFSEVDALKIRHQRSTSDGRTYHDYYLELATGHGETLILTRVRGSGDEGREEALATARGLGEKVTSKVGCRVEGPF